MQSFLSSVASMTGIGSPETPNKCMLDNDTLISIMDQLHKVNMEPEFSLEIPCPHIAVVGDQGLGKSTTLNRLLGSEILPMRQATHENGICTLFPTIYHTVFDGECKDYVIELWCKKIGMDEVLSDTVRTAIFEDIKGLVKAKFAECYAKNENIETVRVVVKGAKLTSKYVVDLPGIRNDRSEQATKIRDHIVRYLDTNIGAIILFFLPSSGPERSSAWSIVNKYMDTHTVIPVLIRPDELGEKDRSVINILGGKTDIKFPNENIFVIKNPNTMNKEVFDITKTDIDEATWFRKHPIYGKYILEEGYSKKFGFTELINKIIQVLNARYCAIMPKILDNAETKLQFYKNERAQLKSKLVINESNKLLIYKSYVDEFLNKIRGVVDGEITSKLSGSKIKMKIKEFCETVSKIKYTGEFKADEIESMVKQCGGTRDLYTKFSEEILINVLFKDDKSPAKQLELLMRQYIEFIARLFKDIINDVDFSNNQLDPLFWANLKEKLIIDIDKKYVHDGLHMLCSAQESYFDFEDEYYNFPKTETKESKYIFTVMEQIWKKYLFIVRVQFGKYIQKHFVEHNLSEGKMDGIFYRPDNIEFLTKFLKEPDETEKRRVLLDRNIDKLKTLIESINKIQR
jgi:GTPase Era involved in 16S rRNA processing